MVNEDFPSGEHPAWTASIERQYLRRLGQRLFELDATETQVLGDKYEGHINPRFTMEFIRPLESLDPPVVVAPDSEQLRQHYEDAGSSDEHPGLLKVVLALSYTTADTPMLNDPNGVFINTPELTN